MPDAPLSPYPPAGSVFLSYASQDAGAAQRIAEALRGAGLEVWFDVEGGLETGDEWDAKIRRQIKACVLFIPVISANTQARHEGYFRIEWDLAAERARGIASGVAFILPVVIDDTREPDALVPDRFRAVQWTRVRAGELTPEQRTKFAKIWSHRTGGLAGAKETGDGLRRPVVGAAAIGDRWAWAFVITLGILVLTLGGWWLIRQRSAPIAEAVAKSQPAVVNVWPRQPELKRAMDLIEQLNSIHEDLLLAEEIAKHAVEQAPGDPEAAVVLAHVEATFLLRNFDFTGARAANARRYGERAVQLAPDHPVALSALAIYLSGRGNDQVRAEALIRRACKLEPDEPRHWRLLAKIVFRQRREDGILQAEDNARRFPDDALTHYDLAIFYRSNTRLVEAERELDRTLALAPVANAIDWKARLSLARGDFEATRRFLEQVPARLRSEERAVLTAFAYAIVGGDHDYGMATLARFPEPWFSDASTYVGPKSLLTALLWQRRGRAESARLQFEAALAEVRRYRDSHPTDTQSQLAESQCLAGLGRIDEARAAYKIFNDSLRRPYLISGASLWIFLPIPTALLVGERATALTLIRESLTTPIARDYYRRQLQLDPRMASFRDDLEISALLAEPAAVAVAPVGDQKSVAVLAFADNSPGRDSEYFSDGISEELINALGKVPGLKVPARTSSFYFKGKSVPMPEIAKQLGVAYVIEGSVQRMGDKVKISARLSKAEDGFQVWTDSFLRDAKDVFAVEEEIAGLIAKQLSLKLGASSAAATASVNPEAFELYVQARKQWNLRTTDGFNRAEDMLNRALTLEPNFGRAHAALGDVWYQRSEVDGTVGAFGDRNSPELARIREKARQALALDPNSAEAHTLMGAVLRSAWQFDEAVRELRLAIALSPTYATAHQRLSRTLLNDGRVDEALAELKLAAELDPLSSRILDNYANALRWAGRYTESLTVAQRAVAVQPDSTQASMAKSRALLALGRPNEAFAVVQGLSEDSDFTAYFAAEVLAVLGRTAEAEAQLSRLKNASLRWLVLAALGRRADSVAAFDALQFSVLQLGDFFFEPRCDPIRDEPRVVQGLAALGLTEAHARAQAWRKAHPPEKVELKP